MIRNSYGYPISQPKFIIKVPHIMVLVISILLWVTIILIFTGIKSFVKPAHVELVIQTNLWKGLIAEDVSGGYQGMYAVACCVRNRLNAGMDHGLVAMKRKDLNQFCHKQGNNYQQMAKGIINKVFSQAGPDITGGATHYEAVERYGLPNWAKDMVKTVKVGEHTYFRRAT
ncbi:MAG: hypothetical protein WC364_13740 [Eubacteriales bacterium]|jgi:hypothetical protein